MGPVAQWLELTAHNGLVGGSSPSRPTKSTFVVRKRLQITEIKMVIHRAPFGRGLLRGVNGERKLAIWGAWVDRCLVRAQPPIKSARPVEKPTIYERR